MGWMEWNGGKGGEVKVFGERWKESGRFWMVLVGVGMAMQIWCL